MKNKFRLLTLIIVFLFNASFLPGNRSDIVVAEDEENPTYIVQPGDSLAGIALRFGVDIDQLIAVNNISDPNALAIGTELILPGLEGISGVLTTINLGVGENLRSLSIRANVTPEVLMRINKLSSPAELYHAANIIIPVLDEVDEATSAIGIITSSSTLLEEAVKQNSNVWKITQENQQQHSWGFLPNQVIFEKTSNPPQAVISPTISEIAIRPDDIYQGNILTITITTTGDNVPVGSWNGRELPFHPNGENTFTALQGIGAMHNVGLNELTISTMSEETKTFSFEQFFLTYETFYPSESITVNPITLDPVTQSAEDELIAEVVSEITEEKYWNQPFLCVVDQPTCVRSWFGTNRNYNNGTYFSFHSGIDYGICATLNIYAPADGVVVFTDSLTIRGNATYIDHGYGVFSAFFHQSEIWVEPGDFVKAGDIIGQIGTTGRSTGGHLHYDLIINGDQVDPLQWLPNDCR